MKGEGLEKITDGKDTQSRVQLMRAQNRISATPERSTYAMTREEARRYIDRLTLKEKQQLNELLKSLEQKRQPSPSPQVSTGKDDL